MKKREKILIYGGSGQIGSRAAQLLARQFEIAAPTHKEADVTDRTQVEKSIRSTRPDHILYAVGFTSIDKAPEQPANSYLLNAGAPAYITHMANKLKIPFHYLSTEVVFDGKLASRPHKEEDKQNPLSFNATTKYLGELTTLDASPRNCVIRLIICYSAHYERKLDLARLAAKKVQAGETFTATNDQEINPIYVDHLIEALATIMENHASGIYHVGATDYTTPYDFAKRIVRALGLDDSLVSPTTFKEFSKTRPEPRPQHEWLDTEKFKRDFGEGILHSVDEGVAQFKKDYLS